MLSVCVAGDASALEQSGPASWAPPGLCQSKDAVYNYPDSKYIYLQYKSSNPFSPVSSKTCSGMLFFSRDRISKELRGGPKSAGEMLYLGSYPWLAQNSLDASSSVLSQVFIPCYEIHSWDHFPIAVTISPQCEAVRPAALRTQI